ncbi:MAG: tetratricopeptide repeat protein [Planctomycetota bacterium]|nr:tetratricopeptide repeat protein [Planctomycetota bacterium]
MTIQQMLESAAESHRAGRLDEAQALYRQILTEYPAQPDALRLLGVLCFQLDNKAAALELLQRSVAADPRIAASHCDLGIVLATLQRIPEAIASYQKAIELQPGFPEALHNLGLSLEHIGRLDDAVAAFCLSIENRPDDAETYVSLGNTLHAKGLWEEAAGAYKKAVELQPNSADAYNNFGNVLQVLGQHDGAVAAYRNALDLRPDSYQAHNNLGQSFKAMGMLKQAITCFDRAIALQPDLAAARSNRVYAMHYLADDPAELLRENMDWGLRHARPLKRFWQLHQNDSSPARRLRIGYISADFRNHVLGRNLFPLWREHNREEFEIFFYSDVIRPDSFTEQIRAFADHWKNTVGMSDERLAELIRRDKIDILIDPTMHMAGNRLLVFARKPAPVQITFGGYPSGTGLSAIDYRFTDPYLDPPGETDHYYVEKSVRLPDSYWCYDIDGMEFAQSPEVGPLPAAVLGHITFGCLNNFCKVSDAALELWRKVLDATPKSRMLLLAPEGSARARVMEALGERVEFVPGQPRRKYLETYQRIDVGLDTMPYNGHTTSLDSFWMGVPIVTLVGKTAVARAGWSQLSNLGLAELAAHTEAQYVAMATELAGNPARLRRLRWTLRQKMLASPLADAKRFTKSVEAAYRASWQARRPVTLAGA